MFYHLLIFGCGHEQDKQHLGIICHRNSDSEMSCSQFIQSGPKSEWRWLLDQLLTLYSRWCLFICKVGRLFSV